MKDLNCGANANYKSPGIAEELIHSCVDVIEEDIDKAIKDSMY